MLIKFLKADRSETSGTEKKPGENAAPDNDFAGQKPDEEVRVFADQNLVAVITDVLKIIGRDNAVGRKARHYLRFR